MAGHGLVCSGDDWNTSTVQYADGRKPHLVSRICLLGSRRRLSRVVERPGQLRGHTGDARLKGRHRNIRGVENQLHQCHRRVYNRVMILKELQRLLRLRQIEVNRRSRLLVFGSQHRRQILDVIDLIHAGFDGLHSVYAVWHMAGDRQALPVCFITNGF